MDRGRAGNRSVGTRNVARLVVDSDSRQSAACARRFRCLNRGVLREWRPRNSPAFTSQRHGNAPWRVRPCSCSVTRVRKCFVGGKTGVAFEGHQGSSLGNGVGLGVGAGAGLSTAWCEHLPGAVSVPPYPPWMHSSGVPWSQGRYSATYATGSCSTAASGPALGVCRGYGHGASPVAVRTKGLKASR